MKQERVITFIQGKGFVNELHKAIRKNEKELGNPFIKKSYEKVEKKV